MPCQWTNKRAPAKKLRGLGRESYYTVCGIALLNITDYSRFQNVDEIFLWNRWLVI